MSLKTIQDRVIVTENVPAVEPAPAKVKLKRGEKKAKAGKAKKVNSGLVSGKVTAVGDGHYEGATHVRPGVHEGETVWFAPSSGNIKISHNGVEHTVIHVCDIVAVERE
jgi:co-chaperonin GroES (HSP10)